jgi:signal transduction histidine kinase
VHWIVTALGVANGVIFVTLSLLAVRRWLGLRDPAAGWLAVALATIALIVSVGRVVPSHPSGFWEAAGQRAEIVLLVLFPYLMFRFATAFAQPSVRLRRVVGLITSILVAWTLLLRHVPATGENRSTAFIVYVVAFLLHWSALSAVVALRLWRAGRGQPGVSRKRMEMLAFAAAALTAAIVGAAFESDSDSAVAALTGALATASGLAFLLGLAPPMIIRTQWRFEEQQRLQEAIRGLMTLATTRAEVAERVLAPVAALVGAEASAIRDGSGVVLASRGDTSSGEPLEISAPAATLLVWTSRYAPFFGDDELRVLQTVAALTGIALDRVRLFEQEHASRVALERANEVMTDFVALAAHELRTPVTTIHGFVQTLNRLGDRLSDAQKDELRTALEQQTRRMANLVEQLLDLSRLDADAVEIRPQQIDLRRRLEEVVAVAAGSRAADVVLDVPEQLDVRLDPSILDHIVTNLVTNAFRYGQPPVCVTAAKAGDSVSVIVEDAGPGVAQELEETLFERFTRAGVPRDRVAGTGLGLAIVRAYARAHRGDVRYERAHPDGARFVVDLPSMETV